MRQKLLKRICLLLVVLAILIVPPIYLVHRTMQQEQRDRALIAALKRYDTAAVTRLLNEGADANARDRGDKSDAVIDWKQALAQISDRLFHTDRQHDTAPTALIVYLISRKKPGTDIWLYPNDEPPIVKSLLDHGANIEAHDANGNTPLQIAAYHDYDQIAALLVERGAKVNVHDAKGRTPLMDAHGALLKAMIQHGADIKAVDKKGMTPLMWACVFAGEEDVRALIDHSDVNAKDRNGTTALMYAVYGPDGTLGKLRLLIDHGADIKAVDKDGMTALKMAERNKEAVLVEFLKDPSKAPSPGSSRSRSTTVLAPVPSTPTPKTQISRTAFADHPILLATEVPDNQIGISPVLAIFATDPPVMVNSGLEAYGSFQEVYWRKDGLSVLVSGEFTSSKINTGICAYSPATHRFSPPTPLEKAFPGRNHDQTLSVVDMDKSIKVRDSVTGKEWDLLKGKHVPLPIICISWSPDGKTLAFTTESNEEIGSGDHFQYLWLIHADGSGLKKLGHGASPYWSPDGRYLLAVDGGCNGVGIFRYSVQEGKRTVLAASHMRGEEQAATFGAACYSPDGKAIAIYGPSDPHNESEATLYLTDAEGHFVQVLAAGRKIRNVVWPVQMDW